MTEKNAQECFIYMETLSVAEWFLKTFERLKKINSVQRLIFHKGFFEMIQKVFLISYKVNWAYFKTCKAEVSSVIAERRSYWLF